MLSHSNTQQVEGFTHPRKTSDFFSFNRRDAYVCARKNFAYSSPMANFSFLVIPLTIGTQFNRWIYKNYYF